jgi:chloride channel 2
MVWYGMVWYGMVWYGMVWYGMVWYLTYPSLLCIHSLFIDITR